MAKQAGVHERLEEQRAHLEPLLEITPTATVISDLDANVVAWNPAAERLFGYTAEEAIGRNLDDLVATTEELHADAVAYSERTSRERDRIHTVTRRTTKEGTLVDVELLTAPLLSGGEAVGILGIYHDITELNRQRRFFESLLEMSPEAIVTTDGDDRVRSWNPAAERLFGYTSEEAIGQDIDELVASREGHRAEGARLHWEATQGRTVRAVTQRTRKDGSLIDVDIVGGPVGVGGEIVANHIIYHDISELQEQKRYFQQLLEISPAAIVVTDLESKVVSWNPAAETLFGYMADEAIGRPLDDLVATRPEIHEEAVGYSEAALRGEGVRAMTQRTRKDGSLVDVSLVSAPVVVNEERVGFLAIYHDISELQEQKRYFQQLLEMSPAAIVVRDMESRVISWNPAAQELFGYTADEAVGHPVDDLVAKRTELHDEAAAYSQAEARGEYVRAVTQRTRKDGSLVDVSLVSAPVVVNEERVGLLAVYHDISELQERKRYFESLLEVSPTAIVVQDLDGNVRSWNPAAERLFGYTAEEAIGRNLDDLVATRADLHEEAEGLSRAGQRREGARAITRRTREDGSLVDVELVMEPVIVGEEHVGLVVIYHDITELQQQKRYYETLVHTSQVAIALMDPQGTVTSWNPAAERLFGYTAEEAIGRNIDDLVAKSAEIRGEAEAYTRQGMSGDLVHAITRRTHKDGTMVDVEMFGAPVIVAGEPAGLYGMFHDIRELQQARQDAEAATEAKSAFLATMSHEIRTPLNAVIGMTGLLLDTPLSAEQRNYAEVIRGSGDALLGVINEILDFSKIEAGRLDLERAPLDLRECVESALELVAAAALEKGLDLAYDLDAKTPGAIVGDLTRLRQILINLLNNAVKFTVRGEVVVTVTAERLDRDDRHRLHFTVRDTGIGIASERMDRLFESFSQVDPSTTRRYGGTGLGLAISRRLAELMGGTLWAESSEGEGSTFHFSIEAERAPAPVRAYERGGAPQLQGKRVLIVDDNATNRHILAKQTASWGMIAVDSGSPAEALEWVRRGNPLDVAILDMQMPEMDGLTLAQEIRRHRDARALPLVMLTSLGRPEDAGRVDLAAYLTKPIRPSQLFDALLGVFGVEPGRAAGAAAPEAVDEEPAERLPLRILVVEDNAMNQQLALLMLQKMGYRGDVAANGVEALEALERQPYDLVLMDVEMPEMDGLEATRRIHRRWPEDQRPHIIAVTANALQGERELCIQAGMDDYITKPIRGEELAAALRRGAGRAAARRGSGPLDRTVIERMVASFGDQGPESVSALIGTFLDHAPGQVARMRSALERGAADEVRREAHTMKSNAASLGAATLADLCRDVQDQAKAGTLERGRDLVTGIASELDRVTGELERIRSELKR